MSAQGRRSTAPRRRNRVIAISPAPTTAAALGLSEAEGSEIPVEDLKRAWKKITKDLSEIVSATDSSLNTPRVKLTTVAIGLKVGAKVKDIFGLTELSGEVSITVTLAVNP